jgi:integrase
LRDKRGVLAKLKIPIKRINIKNPPLTNEELQKIFEVVRTDVRKKAIILTLYRTGVRASGLLNITLDDINFEESTINIRHAKGDKDRKVNITKDGIEAIQEYLKHRKPRDENEEHLFLNENHEKLQKTGLYNLIKSVSARAKIERRIYPHIFRKTLITNLYKNNVGIKEIQAQSGHSDVKVLYSHYIDLDKNHIKKAYEQAMSKDKLEQKEIIDEKDKEIQDLKKQIQELTISKDRIPSPLPKPHKEPTPKHNNNEDTNSYYALLKEGRISPEQYRELTENKNKSINGYQ